MYILSFLTDALEGSQLRFFEDEQSLIVNVNELSSKAVYGVTIHKVNLTNLTVKQATVQLDPNTLQLRVVV